MENKSNSEILLQVKFDEKGLVPVIVQGADGRVVMFAWMNMQALSHTLDTGKMCYYSRSRKKLWIKGEESGNCQLVEDVYIDCDNDALLFKVTQKGGACHKGYYSCFFRKIEPGYGKGFTVTEKKLFNPEEVYKK